MKQLPDILSEGLLTSGSKNMTIHNLFDAIQMAWDNNGDPKALFEIYKFIKGYLEKNYEGIDKYCEYDLGDDDIEEIYNWMDLKLVACIKERTAPADYSRYEYILDICTWSPIKASRNAFRLRIITDRRSGEFVKGNIFAMKAGEYKFLGFMVENADMVYDLGLRTKSDNKKLIDFCRKNLIDFRKLISTRRI